MRYFIVLLMSVLVTANAYGWSLNPFSDEDQAKTDAITVTGGVEGDVLTQDASGNFVPTTPGAASVTAANVEDAITGQSTTTDPTGGYFPVIISEAMYRIGLSDLITAMGGGTGDMVEANYDTEAEFESNLFAVTTPGELDTWAEFLALFGITGTPDGSKFLRDDGSWQTVATSGGATTEAAMETQLTDVTDLFTNNDGALADDDLSDNTTDDLSEGVTNKYDQTVSNTGDSDIQITGTYPNFTFSFVNGSGFLTDIVNDTTPTLGGELDVNGQNIINVSDITFQNGTAGGTLRTGTTPADKFQLMAYDSGLSSYTDMLELDAGDPPIMNMYHVAGIYINSTGSINTQEADGSTFLLNAYDVDGAAYKTFITSTAGDNPTCDLDSDVTIGGSAIVDTTDSRLSDTRTPTDASVTSAKFSAATIVTEAEGAASSDNDTSFLTVAGIIDYVTGLFTTHEGAADPHTGYILSSGGDTMAPKLTISDSATTAPINITERSSAPSSPATGDMYLDDGTNTASTEPGWRRYNGASWEDVSASASSGGTQYGHICLPAPMSGGADLAATPEIDFTNPYYGQAKYAYGTDAASNYVEYRCAVPEDMDTAEDILLENFYVRMSAAGTNTNTQRYIISMDVVSSDAPYSGTMARPVNIDLTETASTASGDAFGTNTNTTLTDWKTDLASNEGALWIIRVARDGNDATYDTSVVDTFTAPLTIRYTKE